MGVRGAVQLCVLLTLATAGLLPEAYCSAEHRGHTFLIVNEQTSYCLKVDNGQLKLDSCSDTKNASLWKWGSSHRLYNLGSQMCLGLDLSKPSDPLKLVSCDSRHMLWWRCSGGHVFGASRYGLAVKNGTVTGLLQFTDTWKVSGTMENICEIPYHVVYTSGENSYGKPCEFPFKFKGSWYHDCIYNATEDLEWCSTSGNFDLDGKRGNCLKPMKDCTLTWTQNAELQQCYQFNTMSVLKWKEAYMSCKSQGADLLSITSTKELKYITDNADLPDFVWIGLNRLESAGGWQWSDKSPLNFINWDKDITAFSVMDGSSCGRLNVNTGQWDVFPCEASLPYICKRRINVTISELPDYWHYSETTCEGNWTAYNGFCYTLQKPNSWKDANLSCQTEGASLISFHSLADIELVVTNFHSESETIWSGFRSESFPNVFKWSDGTEVQFTYWDQNEPLPPFNGTPSCVSFSRMTGRWHVSNCSELLNSICKRPGNMGNATKSDYGCPEDMNWRRHGEFCYLINKTEVTFGARCNLTITNKFEQEFLNSLIREQTNTEGKYFWTSLQDSDGSGDYYWQSARGKKELSYSNWKLHEPAFPGGCVAMAGFDAGKWEVKDCKTFKAQSICKKGIRSTDEETEEVPKPSNDTCPDGWTAGSGLYCYKLFNRERIQRQRNWKEAEDICEEFGGNLVSLSHKTEMKNFHSLLNQWISDKRAIWVGLNKRNLGSWEWSDGRPISSTILDEFQEDDYLLRDCAAVEIHLPKQRAAWVWHIEIPHDPEYSLHPYHCDAPLEWVCQVPKGAVVKVPQWYQPGWRNKDKISLIIAGAEYWFVSDITLNHREAALYCAVNGSELAAIESFVAMTAIQENLRKQMNEQKITMTKWWVKSTDIRSHHQFIFHRILAGAYNNCPFVSALSHYPDYLLRVNCNEKLPFICKTQNFSMIEADTSKPTNFSGSCPANWTAFENKCYLRVPLVNMTFSAASDYCKRFGGMLPSISSQRDQDFITYLSPGLAQKFWIGLRLTLNSAQNSWLDGSGVTYTNFHPLLEGRFKRFEYDPFNKDKSQQCLFILNDPKSSFIGTWDFTSCADQQPVALCQKAIENGIAPPTVIHENVTYEGKSYKIIQRNMTWYSALDECRNQDMDLVSITDQYHLAFLSITVRQVDQPLWIGLSSTEDGTHYRWQDGSVVNLNRWSEGENGQEECVFIAVDGTWKTESCDTELAGAICHKLNHTQKSQDGTIACPHKVQDTVWVPYQNNCYAFLLSHKRWTLNEGRYPCDSLHHKAFVLSIRDEDEKTFIYNHLQPFAELAKWVWLGITYDVNEKSLRWHDKTFVKYSNWRYGRPVVTNNSFYAAMKLDGYWDIFHNPRDFELLFLKQHSLVACKIEGGSAEDHADPLATAIPYAKSTYYVLKKKLTWFEAAKECRQKDGNLVSVHDESQQLFLENIVRQDGFPLWIGLWNNGQGSLSNIEWSDGSAVDYASENLATLLANGNCAYLDTKRTWRAKNCSELLDGAICYKHTEIAMKSKLKASDSQCPKSSGSGRWVRQNEFCYGFDVQIYNYSVYSNEQAKQVCQTLDPAATLLTINDDEENAFVRGYLQNDAFMTRRVWLGVDLNSGDQKPQWIDGTPMKYSNWSAVQGDNVGSCAILLADTGTWNKVPCASGQGRVICKSPAKPSGLGFAIGFIILIILILLIGLAIYLYKKRSSLSFSSIRYRRAEDQMESMIDYS